MSTAMNPITLLALFALLITLITLGGAFLGWLVARNDRPTPRGRNPFKQPFGRGSRGAEDQSIFTAAHTSAIRHSL